MNGQYPGPGPPTPSWVFNAQTTSAQVLPGQFLPFISPGWQWHPGSLFYFLGWTNSRGGIRLRRTGSVCMLIALAGQPMVKIFDHKIYRLHTLYFVEFVPEETPRLENQYILMPPSSGMPSFHVPYPSAQQVHGQPRVRDLIPVAIAGTVALTVGALLEKAFKGGNKAQPIYGPPPMAPPVDFYAPQYHSLQYPVNNSFSTPPASLQSPCPSPSYYFSRDFSSSRSPSSSPLRKKRTEESLPRIERIKELPDSSDEEEVRGATSSGTLAKSTSQRSSERKIPSSEDIRYSSEQRPTTTPKTAINPTLRHPKASPQSSTSSYLVLFKARSPSPS